MRKFSEKIKYGPSFQSARVEERTCRLPSSCAGLAGRTLLFFSDIHLSARFPESAVNHLIDQIASLGPDLILIGGDYGESAAWQLRFFELFSRLTPPLGAFGVLGNNDCECFPADQSRLIEAAAQAGVRILVDQAVTIETEGGAITVSGLDEYRQAKPPQDPLFTEESSSSLRILLSHYPQSSGRHLKKGKGLMPHLAMAGHTHAGQFRILGLTPYSIGYELDIRRYMTAVSGWKRVGETDFLVSPGLGTSRIPYRINAEPTIHLIRLTK